MIFWANREPAERLERMLKDSWCIGIYALDDGTVGADTDSKLALEVGWQNQS